MMRKLKFFILVVFLKLFTIGQATFFGGDNCCCDCGKPMPPSCGCSLPICPPPLPCPPPICPVCKPCSPAPACPPPPIPICPPPQPVYLPSSNCGCGGGGAPIGGYTQTGGYSSAGGYAVAGGYAPPGGPNFAPPPQGGSYVGYQQPGRNSGLPTTFSDSPQPLPPNHMQVPEPNNVPIPPPVEPFPVHNEADYIANQIVPLSSTTATLTERRAHGAVIISENKCNSIVLRDLLLKNMDQTDPVISKRAIHNAAQEIMREDEVDIICSDAGFTYIVSTTEYCEVQKERVICFIYKKTESN